MPKGDDDERQTLKPGYIIFTYRAPSESCKPNPERPTTSVKVGNLSNFPSLFAKAKSCGSFFVYTFHQAISGVITYKPVISFLPFK